MWSCARAGLVGQNGQHVTERVEVVFADVQGNVQVMLDSVQDLPYTKLHVMYLIAQSGHSGAHGLSVLNLAAVELHLV